MDDLNLTITDYNPIMTSYATPTPAPRSCPVETRFDALLPGTWYTLTPTPEEREKLRGSDPTWAIDQARKQGTVFVWLTNEEYARRYAPCHACENEVGPGPWHVEWCEEYNPDERVAA